MKTTTSAVLAGAITLVALIAIGVLITQTRSGDDAQAVATPVLPLTMGGEPSAFLALLRYVPATVGGSVYFSDYAALRDALGLQSPNQDARINEIQAYWVALADGGMQESPISRTWTMRAEDLNGSLGMNITNLDQSLHWRLPEASCGAAHVLLGRFDPARIERTVRQAPSFHDKLTLESHSGVPYLSWHEGCGEGGQAGPGRLVLSNPFVYWNSTSQLAHEGMIDAGAGLIASLAEPREYQLLAQAFVELGVFSAYIEVHSDELWFEPRREVAEAEYGRNEERNIVQTQSYLRPYIGVALGVGLDNTGAYATLIYLHTTEEAAVQNAEILQTKVDTEVSYHSRRPWSETITRSEIEAKGTLVQARFWATDPKFLFRASNNLDGLFMSRP